MRLLILGIVLGVAASQDGRICNCSLPSAPICAPEHREQTNACITKCGDAGVTWERGSCPNQRSAFARKLYDEADDVEEQREELADVEPYEALIFLFVATFLGAVTSFVLNRYAPFLPYTAVVLFEGILIAIIHDRTGHGLGTLSHSIEMWVKVA